LIFSKYNRQEVRNKDSNSRVIRDRAKEPKFKHRTMESRKQVHQTRTRQKYRTTVQPREDVEGKFGLRISYSVIDPNYSDKGEKRFEAGKLTSKKIDSLLSQGKNLQKITRVGSGKDISYIVEAAD
jgi:hypothetical protein